MNFTDSNAHGNWSRMIELETEPQLEEWTGCDTDMSFYGARTIAATTGGAVMGLLGGLTWVAKRIVRL